ncbi:MAG: hypothetical protein MZV70_77415 [Desulfobacterales bacterium]|nr:hypothetical protein [Desulfobacterales bacterium]
MDELYPAEMKKLQQRLPGRDPKQKSMFEKRKKRLADFRNSNPDFNKRILDSRKSIMEQMKDRQKKKKKK